LRSAQRIVAEAAKTPSTVAASCPWVRARNQWPASTPEWLPHSAPTGTGLDP